MIEELNETIKQGNAAYIAKAIQPTFGWETVVNFLAHCADNEVGEPIGILSYKLPLADQIDSVRPVLEYLNENINRDVLGVEIYATLTTNSKVIYSGKNDVLLWNVVGTSMFQIIGGESRTLEPGDLVYIPEGLEYIVKPETPRAFVLFSLEEGKEDGTNETL